MLDILSFLLAFFGYMSVARAHPAAASDVSSATSLLATATGVVSDGFFAKAQSSSTPEASGMSDTVRYIIFAAIGLVVLLMLGAIIYKARKNKQSHGGIMPKY
ncbi:hypothetical protein GGI04_001076 [Coemansia thaxteri]|uniref:Uncharacterized protein n=1 Tax=Coemansia thaxteri TaxID=2663907 RepID=A0A9W8BFP6_9FUNG|nr:hypothetical protein H4R26_001848 [Coemansia thaxteri]KAJ2008580.1 hypothetical protein GGI04_001076 [Coemansia thaxteri]KAJ2474433.1 hypothetical protein GGI02_000055 [Coemansia sp. RSA 2322]